MRLIAIFLVLLSFLSSKKLIVVDLTTQEAYAYEDGELIIKGEVSTGRPSHPTPKGEFKILQKELRHTSNKYPEPYGGARMDYMMRLTNSGVAMHLGFVPNYPASHGCIRLKNGFAQRLYAWAPVGTKVIIRGNPPLRVTRAKYKNLKQTINSSKTDNIYLPKRVKKSKRRVLVFDDMQEGSYNHSSSKYYYKYETHQGKVYKRKVIVFDDLN